MIHGAATSQVPGSRAQVARPGAFQMGRNVTVSHSARYNCPFPILVSDLTFCSSTAFSEIAFRLKSKTRGKGMWHSLGFKWDALPGWLDT